MKDVILSPFRNCDAHLKIMPDTAVFRGKPYHFMNHFYVCDDTGEEFTDEFTGRVNSTQVYNQYREENNIPYVSEIIKLRLDCKLSKADMGRLMGFGENQYYQYEMGEVPSLSNGRLMRTFIDNRNALSRAIADSNIKDAQKEKSLRALSLLSEFEAKYSAVSRLIFTVKPGLNNGYSVQSVEKVKQIILFFLKRMPYGYKTALNKLLFYTDFLMYKSFGIGMSGLSYSALPHGNVPNNFKLLYGVFEEIEEVDDERSYFMSHVESDMSVFSEEEIEVLKCVADKLANLSCSALSDINHEEESWLKYRHDTKLYVPYSEAFFLKAL